MSPFCSTESAPPRHETGGASAKRTLYTHRGGHPTTNILPTAGSGVPRTIMASESQRPRSKLRGITKFKILLANVALAKTPQQSLRTLFHGTLAMRSGSSSQVPGLSFRHEYGSDLLKQGGAPLFHAGHVILIQRIFLYGIEVIFPPEKLPDTHNMLNRRRTQVDG